MKVHIVNKMAPAAEEYGVPLPELEFSGLRRPHPRLLVHRFTPRVPEKPTRVMAEIHVSTQYGHMVLVYWQSSGSPRFVDVFVDTYRGSRLLGRGRVVDAAARSLGCGLGAHFMRSAEVALAWGVSQQAASPCRAPSMHPALCYASKHGLQPTAALMVMPGERRACARRWSKGLLHVQ